MNSSFYNGISGVKTHQFGMDIWSNNISNINTAGYKYSIPEFSTIFSQSINEQYDEASTNDIGLGSMQVASTTNLSMGALVKTDNKYDMAINGKGFFGVQDSSGEVFFSRNGNFSKDADGNLVDIFGNYVLGQSANNISNGIVTKSDIGDIKLEAATDNSKIVLPDKLTLPAQQTTYVKMQGNLDSTPKYKYSENDQMVEVPNVEVYRSELFKQDGGKNFLEVKFTKQVPQGAVNVIWDATATVTDENGDILSTNSGVLTFDSKGALISNTLNSIKNDGIEVELDLGTPKNSTIDSDGRDGLVSYSSNKNGDEKIITKDGYLGGELVDYGIDSLGNIQAIFDNGKSVPIYKVVLFDFINEQGLNQTDSTYFQKTSNSGDPKLLLDNNGNSFQNISSGHLEMSNVDLSTAMTELIVMQKAYEANAKSITTSDQMIQNAINMKN